MLFVEFMNRKELLSCIYTAILNLNSPLRYLNLK